MFEGMNDEYNVYSLSGFCVYTVSQTVFYVELSRNNYRLTWEIVYVFNTTGVCRISVRYGIKTANCLIFETRCSLTDVGNVAKPLGSFRGEITSAMCGMVRSLSVLSVRHTLIIISKRLYVS